MSFNDADLLSPETHGFDREPFYAWLRDECPLYYDEKNALWAVSRYDDVVHVSKNTEIFCSRFGTVPGVPLDEWPDEAMINKDGEEHTCQRRLVSKGFTPKRIADMEDEIVKIVDGLLDSVEARGQFDLVRDLARPFPMAVIGTLLGYPPEKCADVLDWTDAYAQGGEGGVENITPDVMAGFTSFVEFHNQILEERKRERGDDLISLWLDAELNGERLSDMKLLFEHNLLLFGGSETTRHAISVGMYEILKRPEDVRYLASNAEAIPNAVEEMIRWTTPFVRMQRTLLQDHEMHGRTMKKGDKIVMLYPAANRDPRVFDDPQEFDIRRDFQKPALSFGYGKHYCLGAALARLEMRLFVEGLLTRFPELAIAPGADAVAKRSAWLRGIAGLPVVVSPPPTRHDSVPPPGRSRTASGESVST